MKRIVALAAAALICSTGGSLAAKAKAFTISLDGFCDNYDVTIKGLIATARDAPSCGGQYGGGLLATVKGFGKAAILALQDPNGAPGVQVMLELSYPFTDGGTFTIYQTTDGVNFVDESDGTYSVGTDAQRGPKSDHPITSLFHR
jgi:hypothetical protein